MPVARELPAFASFLAILAFMILFAEQGAGQLGTFLSIFYERADEFHIDSGDNTTILQQLVFLEIAKVLGSLVFLLMLAGIGASVVQNVPRFVLNRIQPQNVAHLAEEGLGAALRQEGLGRVRQIGRQDPCGRRLSRFSR